MSTTNIDSADMQDIHKIPFKDEGRLQKAMSPGNLTFYCVKYNEMSIERAFYCNPVAGLYARASLTIKVICCEFKISVYDVHWMKTLD